MSKSRAITIALSVLAVAAINRTAQGRKLLNGG